MIRELGSVNGRPVLHGGEVGRGWAVTVQEETGRFTGAIATEGEGYVIYGQCVLQ